jgi:hypothetical protein
LKLGLGINISYVAQSDDRASGAQRKATQSSAEPMLDAERTDQEVQRLQQQECQKLSDGFQHHLDEAARAFETALASARSRVTGLPSPTQTSFGLQPQ